MLKVCEIEVDPLLECKPTGDAEGNTDKKKTLFSYLYYILSHRKWKKFIPVVNQLPAGSAKGFNLETLQDIYIYIVENKFSKNIIY